MEYPLTVVPTETSCFLTGRPAFDTAMQSVSYMSESVPGVVEVSDRKMSASVERVTPVPFAREPENTALIRNPLLHFSSTG
jgi:hypothetical protein